MLLLLYSNNEWVSFITVSVFSYQGVVGGTYMDSVGDEEACKSTKQVINQETLSFTYCSLYWQDTNVSTSYESDVSIGY